VGPRIRVQTAPPDQPLRLDWIDDNARIAGKKVVDIGCGGGILAESMAARGAQVTGVDLSEKALGVARLHLFESGQQVDYRTSPPKTSPATAPPASTS
jgi:2-polyprenyl-6-hydroxyphenyl methylase/3-demethylubiquinone-9 3-methyltransferase